MKFNLILLVSISTQVILASTQSLAFSLNQTIHHPNARVILKNASKNGLKLSGMAVKNEIEKYKSSKFIEVLEKKDENPPGFQSYLYEIRDGRLDVEEAKLMASQILYSAVERDWSTIQTTIFNDMNIKEKSQLPALLKRKLEALVYVPVKSSNKKELVYHFEASNWGKVKIVKNVSKKTYKLAEWNLDINSTYDGEKISPDADNVKIATGQ